MKLSIASFFIFDHVFGACLYQMTLSSIVKNDEVVDLGFNYSQIRCTLMCQGKRGKSSFLTDQNQCLCSDDFVEADEDSTNSLEIFSGSKFTMLDRQVYL